MNKHYELVLYVLIRILLIESRGWTSEHTNRNFQRFTGFLIFSYRFNFKDVCSSFQSSQVQEKKNVVRLVMISSEWPNSSGSLLDNIVEHNWDMHAHLVCVLCDICVCSVGESQGCIFSVLGSKMSPVSQSLRVLNLLRSSLVPWIEAVLVEVKTASQQCLPSQRP